MASQQASREGPAKPSATARAEAVIVLLTVLGVLSGSLVESYNIASGTGVWIAKMSLKWAVAVLVFAVFCVVCFVLTAIATTDTCVSRRVVGGLGQLRDRIRALRWPIALLMVMGPVLLLQYSSWGVVLSGPYLRILLWCVAGAVLGFLFSSKQDRLISWSGGLVGLLMSGASFAVASAFTDVTNYPFSLGWSEGNRLWDYSLLFARRLYAYSPTDVPVPYLDIGRELAGGLPFLLPRVSILGERLWVAGLGVLPYVLFGLCAFWPRRGFDAGASILAGVWVFMFLTQGPIHTPLLICAAMVAIAWRLPLWAAAPLLIISGYSAEVSRFTWMFAPALWAVMLEVVGQAASRPGIFGVGWRRAAVLGGAGIIGAALGVISGLLPSTGTAVGSTTAASTSQALLWYRLFPNATYGNGILLGLAIAAGPLLVCLLLLLNRAWRLTWLQRLVLYLPLAAFLLVGLVVSTKIGGGGDLHNLDMFLIGLVFIAALAWKTLGTQAILAVGSSSVFPRLLTVALIAIPAYQPLMALRPLSFSKDLAWLSVLTGVDRSRDMGSLPDDDVVRSSLDQLTAAVHRAQPAGDVLFMDQRQLLTFGSLRDVPLVGAYEKKLLMDQALSKNRAYFDGFYKDLAAHRFSLIVSSPLRTPIRDSDYGFGEENNAWVQWVAKPILCYYEEQDTLNDVKVELLVPRAGPTDCAASLP